MAGGIASALGLLALVWLIWLRDSAVSHRFPVTWPVSAPRGEPIPVAPAPKEGEVFVSDVRSMGNFALSAEDEADPRVGAARMDMRWILGRTVEAKPGGGKRLRIKAVLDRAASNIAEISQGVWSPFFSSAYQSTVDLGADGRPDRATIAGDAKNLLRRGIFDTTLQGLGDALTNYLPGTPVRLGEAWDLASVADLGAVETVVRTIGRSTGEAGFPPTRLEAKASAEDTETRNGEPTLRLRFLLTFHQEGEVTAPAIPGWLSTAAVMDGHAWVSLGTGLLWEMDLVTRILSSYRTSGLKTERKGQGTITWTTKRAEAMPGE